MLYTSTRDNQTTWTARHALDNDRTQDGGLFVPVHLPRFSPEEILELLNMAPSDAAARILNLLFAGSMSGRDLEFLVGKEFFRIRKLNHRLTIGELWRNPEGEYDKTVQTLFSHLCGDHSNRSPSIWAKTAVELALIFGVFTQQEYRTVASLTERKDVAVATGDFTAPMAAWYARQMGLPIGAILCCCNDNGGVWDLLRKGQMKTDILPIPTNTPLCDIPVPTGLEWLIYETLGTEGALGFAHAAETGDAYELDQVSLSLLKKGLYATVVGQQRIMDIIPNVYSAGGYVLSPYSALCYLGLMDHRAMTGANAPALMLSHQNPADSEPLIAKAMGIDCADARERIKYS